MTISVWRYSHLALAISSFVFVALAAITGIVLAFEPVNEKIPSYRADDFNRISIAQTIPALKNSFDEITEVNIDANQFVIVNGIDTAGNDISVYVNPATGKILAPARRKSDFFQWVTNLHRSLFLHELGGFFIGLASFLLLLITVSGVALVIQRQRGLKRFFTKIVKENFAQYWHVVLGRLSLIPVFIIAITGTYLSLIRFDVFPEKKTVHQIDLDKAGVGVKKNLADFSVFKAIALPQVRSIEYPFSDDPEEYYLVKLKDRELAIDQFTGEKLSEIKYPFTSILTNFSLDLHTGRTSIIWALVLAIACINILFFIWSGFVITLKRISNKIRNKYKAEEARYVILMGSENGSTLRFANALHQQLLANGQVSFITELNKYKLFPKAEHIIVFTATYGLGNPPSNASRFSSLIKKYPQDHPVHYSVVGFGSHAYPEFCKFAFEVHSLLSAQEWAIPLLDIHTVNDKSPSEFGQWFTVYSQKLNLPQMQLPEDLHKLPAGLHSIMVSKKTAFVDEGGSFLITLQPWYRSKFSSGDLLAIYPANDHRERLYSIGKVEKAIQLSVKRYPSGLGSGYLYTLRPGDIIQARIVANEKFHFPPKAPAVIMVSNGTGIAPFLGMIDENEKKTETHLYCGFRDQNSFILYSDMLVKNKELRKLFQLNVAYSREGEKQYVSDLLLRDGKLIADKLMHNAVLMICGSLTMEKDVLKLLDTICQEYTGNTISYYQSNGQVLSDCY